jgi:class 3 adenylate cyclase
MEGYPLTFSWQFPTESRAESLWPLISNLNLLFKTLGLSPVKPTAISREKDSNLKQLSTKAFLNYVVWEELPYHWEYPARLGTSRSYKIGAFRDLRFQVDLTNFEQGSIIRVKLLGNARNSFSKQLAGFYMTNILRHKLRKTIEHFDKSLQNGVEPYENNKPKNLPSGSKNRIIEIQDELIKRTRRPRAVKKLIEFITKAESWHLHAIHPYELAEIWGENKYATLNVFLNAAKLELLDFGWDVTCPRCKNIQQHIHKLSDLHSPVYCKECKKEVDVDFNDNVHLVFRPHPLIRKPADKVFAIADPQSKKDVLVQQYLNIGDVKYLKVYLEEGTYLVRRSDSDQVVTMHVEHDGLDTVNIILSEATGEDEEVTVTTDPNITLTNRTHEPVLLTIEKSGWQSRIIHASEIVSQHDFKSLYNEEIFKEGQNFKAGNLTILFTDLMDSTSIYKEHGEELAIGHVMSHFKIIQQIVAEERGSIIKTIGDSVMAVFRNPMNAVKAVQRIQDILSNSTSLGDSFKLKAGIHMGDCTAVNLNNRIDYFGTTVNIASRLVDYASEREIVVSEEVYAHPEVRRFLNSNNDKLFVKETNASLKGFKDDEFPIRQIRLEKTKLRLVI